MHHIKYSSKKRTKKIDNGHWTVYPLGSKYVIDYVDNIGLVKIKKSWLKNKNEEKRK